MRRRDREVTDIDKVKEILLKGQIIHLGMNDGEYPYVIPLHYGYEFTDDNKLVFYMHGAKEGHKVDLVKENQKVGFEIECDIEVASGGDIACQYSSFYASVIGHGDICIVDDVLEKMHGLNVLMKTQTGKAFSITPQMAETVSVLKLSNIIYTAKSRSKISKP